MKKTKQIENNAKIVNKYLNSKLKGNPKKLYDAAGHLIVNGGKRLRPYMVIRSCQILGGKSSNAMIAASAVEMVHNFTLVHDDIMDKAPLRRGNATVHEKWNNNVAILSGDTMIVKSYQLMTNVDSSIVKEVLNLFGQTAIKVCEGQQWDMDFETQSDVPLSDYMRMIEYKTAVLLAASLKIGGITAGANTEQQNHLYEFGRNLGIAFQLKDDLLDAFGSPDVFGKKVGGDILANKKTFLYLKALQLADDSIKRKLQVYYTTNDKSELKVNGVKEIFKKYKLDQVVQAHEDLEGRKILGPAVIIPN